MSNRDMLINGLSTECPYCHCKPGEYHGPTVEARAAEAPAYPDDNDPED